MKVVLYDYLLLILFLSFQKYTPIENHTPYSFLTQSEYFRSVKMTVSFDTVIFRLFKKVPYLFREIDIFCVAFIIYKKAVSFDTAVSCYLLFFISLYKTACSKQRLLLCAKNTVPDTGALTF